MGVAVPRALVGCWGLGPLKSLVTGPSLLVNRYLENKFHKKSGWSPPLTTRDLTIVFNSLYEFETKFK